MENSSSTLSRELKEVMDTSPLTPAGQSHRMQLDGIRALAVLLVMTQHYIPQSKNWIELGSVGVRVFFVLSGFLITGILLRARRDAETDGGGKGKVLGNFYIRRFLRIFPLFYLVLMVTYATGVASVRASFWWHASYLSNVFLFRHGDTYGSVTHLWSLTVEEQFYLVWPMLILYCARRWLLGLILIAIAMGPIFRACVLGMGGNAWQASILTPACLDTLGLGALLALVSERGWGNARGKLVKAGIWIGVPVFLVVAVGEWWVPSKWWTVGFDVGIGLWAMALIDGAYRGFTGVVGAVLSAKPLTYLGLISYGVYVIHNFLSNIAKRGLGRLGVHSPSEYTRAGFMFLMTMVLASMSWQFFEKPINRLKRWFPYRGV